MYHSKSHGRNNYSEVTASTHLRESSSEMPVQTSWKSKAMRSRQDRQRSHRDSHLYADLMIPFVSATM